MTKTVLITGGTRGIGKACSEIFLKNNNRVIMNYYANDQEAIKTKIELQNKYNQEITLLKGDIADEEVVKTMINTLKERNITIDVLINNAGIAKDNDIQEKNAEEFMQVLKTNLLGTYLLSKHIKSIMNSGCIINISSTNGIDTSYPESIDYDASKAGIISLTHNFAKYYAPAIRVNTIAPGWVNTDMNKELEETFKQQEIEKILLKRFAEPHEIATVVYFLTTKEASYINDTIIRVDGGIG